MKQFIKKPFYAASTEQSGHKEQPELAPDEIPTVEQPAISDQSISPYSPPPAQDLRSSPDIAVGTGGVQTRQVLPVTKKKGRRSITKLPRWARVALVVLVALIILGGGGFAYYKYTYAGTINDITGQAAIRKGAQIQADPLTERTNIVLLGSDTDGKGNDPKLGQPLAQTVIIITIDPKTNYVGMLSIPRDMQVSDTSYFYPYPGGKIDETFQAAWQGTSTTLKARAAAGHIMDVIQNNYGIRIDHYVWVGLQGFVKVIDDLGGVNIDVTHPITDDDYPDDTDTGKGGSMYDYRRLYLPPGPQHLSGQEALEYVRTRHADLGGDFGRTARQQQILSQIKEEVTQSDAITQAPQILKSLDGYLMTDLTINQLASFEQIAQRVDSNKIDRASLTPPTYAQEITNGRGNYAPICSAIEQKVRQMFATQPTCITQPTTGMATPPQTPLAQSASQHQEGNGSGDRPIGTPDIQNIYNLLLFATSGSFSALKPI